MNKESVLFIKDHQQKLTVAQLAEAIFEGTPHLGNLAEKLARQHGQAGALTFFGMMGEDVRNMYMHVAQGLVDHAAQWAQNEGSACMLNPDEAKRLVLLPRHPQLYNGYAGYKYVIAERTRQLEILKFDDRRDDTYTDGQLYLAGESYLQHYQRDDNKTPPMWPWTPEWWKPSKGTKNGDIKQLAKAGACFLAEQQRLERAGAENNINELTRARTLMGYCVDLITEIVTPVMGMGGDMDIRK